MNSVRTRRVIRSAFFIVCSIAVSGCGSLRDVKNNNINAEPNSPSANTTPNVVAAAAPTTETSNILFIIDASGSMKAKAGDKTKMEAAKGVVTDLIGQLPSDVQAGLMAYGHRQKSDCKDVELLVPIGPVDKAVFDQKVRALQPLGETPISFSILQAADVLKNVKGKKSIILISDGEESCKEDPCEVAKELKSADIDLKIHVVGFGIDSAVAKRQLRCIAEATEGTYAEANDAGQLKEKIAEAARADLGNFISVIQDMDGNGLKFGISFYKPGAKDGDDPIDSTLNLGTQLLDSEHALNIPSGTYDVRYTSLFYPTLWKRNVEVKADQQTQVEFLRFGRIRISIKDQNGQEVNMWTEVHDGTPEEKDLTGDHRFKETLDLPAGAYDLKFWGGGEQEVWQKGVVVNSGQETPVNLRVTVGN